MPPILQIKNATVIRDKTTILEDVSWSVNSGEHWAVLGSNGSGKTTLLKVLTGYEWPTVGSVWLMGERFGETNIPELRKRIGWVSSSLAFQCKEEDSAGAIVLSGYDASIGLWREEFTDDEMRKAALTLRRLGADHIVERQWRVLSQGERQRTLIARALVADPALLILDEPCAGLDPVAREKLLVDLGTIANSKNAPNIIFVTHHIEEISDYISNILSIKDGKILDCGPKEEVLTSERLSDIFGQPMELVKNDNRCWMTLDDQS